MKKLIGKEVVAETKRCARIVLEAAENPLLADLAKKILKGCPYFEFYPELRKLIPKDK